MTGGAEAEKGIQARGRKGGGRDRGIEKAGDGGGGGGGGGGPESSRGMNGLFSSFSLTLPFSPFFALFRQTRTIWNLGPIPHSSSYSTRYHGWRSKNLFYSNFCNTLEAQFLCEFVVHR